MTAQADPPARVTRGSGRLEPLLARLRARKANGLIDPGARAGRILDIGCGSYPFFLAGTAFAEKHGVDRVVEDGQIGDVTVVARDILDGEPLPYPDAYFDVVTMLAVFEHIPRERLGPVLEEAYRVVAPGGVLIMTTPSSVTGPILDAMARVGLVSHEEIDEHEASYSVSDVREVLANSPFPPSLQEFGRFELGMNLWVRARKPRV
jgi:SAM-dependent methyltransferase